MKDFSQEDRDESCIVEGLYSMKEYKDLVNDFIYYLHNAENWMDTSNIPEKQICICFRVYFKQELQVSVKDNKPVFAGIGIDFVGVGKIHENNEMEVSSTTNLKRGDS